MTGHTMADTGFSTFHPAVLFGYFVAVLACSMTLFHPALLLLSLLGAFLWAVRLGGLRRVRFVLLGAVPLVLLAALFNGLFNHLGVTVLLFINDNPLTLESLFYGAATAVMLCAVLLWFSCWNAVMSSDKLLCVLGGFVPALSLLFSMALRLVPRFRVQAGKINMAQRGVGRGTSSGRLASRIRSGSRNLSILTTWALENGIDTADSMCARGYGLRGRTQYSNYRFSARDGVMLAVLLLLAGVMFLGVVSGNVESTYFPFLRFTPVQTSWPFLSAYGLLCFLPFILDVWEALQWKHSLCKM